MRPRDDAFAPDPAGFRPTDIPTPAGGEGPRRFRPLSRWQGAVMALLTGAIVIGACSGDNLWTGDSTLSQPKIIGITAPSTVAPGDTILVQVSAYAQRRVASVEVQLAGAAARDTVVNLAVPAVTAVGSARIILPVFFADTVLVIRAIAYDADGTASRMRSDTATAIAPPAVVDFSGPDSVRAGQILTLQVHARGVRPVTRIRVGLAQALTAQDSIVVAAPATDVQDTIMFPAPSGAFNDTLLVVNMQAVDNTGLVGPITRGTLPVAISGGPRVDSLTAPDSIRSGTTLDVRVFAHGPRPITSVTLSLRGAYNTDVSVPPTGGAKAVITQDFSVPLSGVAADSLLVVNAKVTDQSGALSNILSKTIRISDTAPPTVNATLPKPSVAAGGSLAMHLVATDNIGLATLGVSLLDASKSVLATTSLPVTGRSQDTTVYLTIPLMATAQLSAIGYAIDRANNQATSPALSVTVIDSMPPLDTIRAPAPGTTYPLGDSVLVTVRAASIAGIKAIALSGFSIRGGGTSNTYVVPRFTTNTVTFPQPPSTRAPRDTVISRWLKAIPDTTSEMVNLVSQVTDSANNVAWDTVQVGVGGPLVQILTPASGVSVTVLQPFQVRVFARDKSVGLDSVTILATGALRDSIKSGPLNGVDTVRLQGNFTPPDTGSVTISARAWNHHGIGGQASPVTIYVATVGTVTDTQRPSVQIASIQYKGLPLADNARLELTDTIAVTVKAEDNGGSGVRRVGLTVSAATGASVAGIRPLGFATAYAPAQAGEVAYVFNIVPREFLLSETMATSGGAPVVLGKTLNVQLLFTAFAQDAAPASYCGASVSLAVYDSLPCAYAAPPSTATDSFFTAAGTPPYSKWISLVGGRTVTLPSGGRIADEVVDEGRNRLYLSNIDQNKIDVMDLTDTTFLAVPGLVGSQPWGIFLNDNHGAHDSLFVANSGSTNISVVALDNLTEDVSRRIFTPNEVLWQIDATLDATGYHYTIMYFDFSDRPQFVAQDSLGRLVYSTEPTGAASDGTLRYAVPPVFPRDAGKTMEPKLLFNAKAINRTSVSSTAIAFLDSVVVTRQAGYDEVRLCDHDIGHPNDPTRVFCSPVGYLADEIAWMQDTTHTLHPADTSDIVAYAGSWDIKEVGLSDTTFMAASEHRNWIVFGEGAVSPARIIMWDGAHDSTRISSDVSVSDLISNADERVFGLGLNANGGLGIARGTSGAYYFSPDLRLQGLFLAPGAAGGAALHPSNTWSIATPTDTANGLSFISTPTKSIKVVDALHFFLRGEIQLRDQVVGPVKAGLALPHENEDPVTHAPLAMSDPNYILAKLYCVTADASGNTQVVMVNVRNKDLTN